MGMTAKPWGTQRFEGCLGFETVKFMAHYCYFGSSPVLALGL